MRSVGPAPASARRVLLESTCNTRDLGGLPTADGRTTRWGVLIRTDAVLAPTESDLATLAGFGLRHAVDFRAPAEIAAAGPNVYPPAVTHHAVPLLDASTEALTKAIQTALRSGDPDALRDALGDGRAAEIASSGPTALIRTDAARLGFARVLRLLAADGGTALAFNCSAGKDRTGMFAAIVQRLLGVAEDDVLGEYEFSNACRADVNRATLERLAGAGVDIEMVRPLIEQDGANLAAMLRAVDVDFGSFERFVEVGLGIDQATVETLRETLLV